MSNRARWRREGPPGSRVSETRVRKQEAREERCQTRERGLASGLAARVTCGISASMRAGCRRSATNGHHRERFIRWPSKNADQQAEAVAAANSFPGLFIREWRPCNWPSHNTRRCITITFFTRRGSAVDPDSLSEPTFKIDAGVVGYLRF